jgi:hypothetical protein
MINYPSIIIDNIHFNFGLNNLKLVIAAIHESICPYAFVYRDDLDLIPLNLFQKKRGIGSGIEIASGEVRPTATSKIEIIAKNYTITESWKAILNNDLISMRLYIFCSHRHSYEHFRSLELFTSLILEIPEKVSLSFSEFGLEGVKFNISKFKKFVVSHENYGKSIFLEK